MISEEQAKETARNNASKMYRDLSVYEVTTSLINGDWHVNYRLKNPRMVGGGPQYVISGKTGEILSYRYSQ